LFDRFAAGRRFPANLPTLVAFEQRPYASSDNRVIVDDEDAQRRQPASSPSGNRTRTIVP